MPVLRRSVELALNNGQTRDGLRYPPNAKSSTRALNALAVTVIMVAPEYI